jgi:hypothetical protein
MLGSRVWDGHVMLFPWRLLHRRAVPDTRRVGVWIGSWEGIRDIGTQGGVLTAKHQSNSHCTFAVYPHFTSRHTVLVYESMTPPITIAEER